VNEPISIEEVVEILEEATLSLPASITPDTELRRIKGLDSMGMVSFLGMIQDYVGVAFQAGDFKGCRTPRDLLRVMRGGAATG
jgi:acyl carrier protein